MDVEPILTQAQKDAIRLCAVFDEKTPEMEEICTSLREGREINSDLIEDRLLLASTTPQARLVLGFRKLLRLYADSMLPQDHPDIDLIRSIVYARIIEHELDMDLEYEKARESLDADMMIETQTSSGQQKWGPNSINDRYSAMEDARNSVVEVLDFFENPEDRERYVHLVNPAWTESSSIVSPGGASWNDLLRTSVLNFARVKILHHNAVTIPAKLEPIMTRLKALLEGIDFRYLSYAGFTRLIVLLTGRLPIILGKGLATKLKPTVSPSRQPLSAENMDKLLDTVKYPHAFKTVGDAATNKVRLGLRKQLKGIQIEPVFIQQLESLLAAKFKAARVPRGHKVGMIAAQAFGENASQAGLRSFHHAGVTSDTGFDRINNITNMSSKNPFTIVALKDMKVRKRIMPREPAVVKKGSQGRSAAAQDEFERVPATLQQASHYANLIESVNLGNLCTFHIGRRDREVPEMSDVFQGSTVFQKDVGGWQDRYVALLGALGVTAGMNGESQKAGLEPPSWFIRAVCDKDIMFQRRISMEMIATAIEKKMSSARVIISDILQGEIDIYTISPEATDSAKIHRELRIEVIPVLKGIKVQGVNGFEKAIVEKYDIIKFITHTEQVGPNIAVHFSQKDVAYNGVTDTQIVALLRLKSGEATVQRDPINVYLFWVMDRPIAPFAKRLREQEAVKLGQAVLEPLETRVIRNELTGKNEDVLIVQLNRPLLREEHGISTMVLIDFFKQQANHAKQFSSASIEFDPATFRVTIGKNPSFTPEVILGEIQALYEEDLKMVVEKEKIVVPKLPKDVDIGPLQRLVSSYLGTVVANTSTVAGGERLIRLSLFPLKPLETWKQLTEIKGSCPPIFTEFVSRKQAISYRYRILTRGKGTVSLSELSFVNIYATIPSTPVEIYENFDIEATRTYVLGELVLNAGAKVGNRHLGLLADTLTYMGVPVKMQLSGKVATESGVLATASFQEAFRIMLDASASTTADSLKSGIGMTLIGDFRRGPQDDVRIKREARVDSAIDLLMDATVTSSQAGKKSEKIRARRKQQTRLVVNVDAVAKEFPPEDGSL